MTRPSARHPLALFEGRKACPREGGEDYGVPGAAKNTGASACLGANRVNPARVCVGFSPYSHLFSAGVLTPCASTTPSLTRTAPPSGWLNKVRRVPLRI